jgi:hypothetical protein
LKQPHALKLLDRGLESPSSSSLQVIPGIPP